MEIEELTRRVRAAVVQSMCEAMELPTHPRPIIEALDQYLGAALIGQRVVEILGLVPTRVENPAQDPGQ